MNTASATFTKLKKNKNRFVLFILLLTSLSVRAQNTATVSGKIDNLKATSMILYVDRLHLGRRVEEVSSPVTNGQFQFTAKLDHASVLELEMDDKTMNLFLEPGDNLQVDIKDNAVTFSGKGAEQNTFMKKFHDKFMYDFEDTVMQPKILTMSVDAFEPLIFTNRKKQTEFFKSASDKEKFSPAFSEYIQNTITYRYWNLLFSYPISNANNNNGLNVTPLPAVMLDDFKIQVSNDAAMISEPYREFLKYYVVYFTSSGNSFNKFTDFSIAAERKSAVAKDKLNGESYKYWLTRFSIDECPRVSPFMAKKLYTLIKDADKEGQYALIANDACSARISMKEEPKVDVNAVSPEIQIVQSPTGNGELDLTDINGKSVSLSDFKGKVVYIDFWASWCGPCRKMMPFSKQLHEELTDKQKKQITFLYISIDADPNSWKKAMQDLGIKGSNVISPGNWNSKVCRYFQINGIPRYMIMNKKGDIVDFNAKRPEDPIIMEDLMKYVLE